MYKFLLFITIIIFTTVPSMAVYPNISETLSKIENSLYGFDYNKDKAQDRLSRIEKTVYGKNFSDDINNRIKRLSGDISADVIGLEITPTEDTFKQIEEDVESLQADNSVNYPIVDEIEQKLFNTTYPQRDFHTRIVTIEKKLFGKIYDVDDYSKRMDRIKSKMFPPTISESYTPENQSYYTDKDINAMDFSPLSKIKPKNLLSSPFGQRNYTRPYTNYGNYDESCFDSNDSDIESQLSQMEYETFGTEFSDESVSKRIKRLNSVNKAKKSSSRYDSNKFQQKMATAMEIGAMILMILAMVL